MLLTNVITWREMHLGEWIRFKELHCHCKTDMPSRLSLHAGGFIGGREGSGRWEGRGGEKKGAQSSFLGRGGERKRDEKRQKAKGRER